MSAYDDLTPEERETLEWDLAEEANDRARDLEAEQFFRGEHES